MSVLAELAKQISEDLNDYAAGHEFTTWSEEQIINYIMDGFSVAYTFRKDLFLQRHVFKLEPATSVQIACGCTQIRRVYGVCTKDGRVLYGLRKRKAQDKLQWYGKTCPVDPAKYRARDYYVDAEGDTFYIEPAPPVGKDTYVLLECSKVPVKEDVDTAVLPDELKSAVIQWALFRAKMVDGENNSTIYNVANMHKQTFFQLLQVQVAMKDSIEVDRTSPNSAQVRVADNG